MSRRTPRYTRTATLFPYTTRFRSSKAKLNHCSPGLSLSFLGRTDTAMDDLLNDFLAETAEILAEAGGAIVAWEADPADRAQLDAIFSFVHTIKGSSGFLALSRVPALSHAAEDALEPVRRGTRAHHAALRTRVLRRLP